MSQKYQSHTISFCMSTHGPVKNNASREQREEKREMAMNTHASPNIKAQIKTKYNKN